MAGQQLQYPSSPLDPPVLGGNVVCLALQGGASLGAYTWGVLDAIMEDGRLSVEGLTGSSAGAINAAAFGVGWATSGREGARDRLKAFWEELARTADATRRGRFDTLLALMKWLPRIRTADAFYALTTRLVADFRITPDTMEPLRGVLSRALDLSVLGRTDAIKVFINATDVQTGHPETFTGGQIDTDVVCASCAVPFIFKPILIGDRWFWDGGLIGNPAIYPVIYNCDSSDIVLVETLPAKADTVPDSSAAVLTRTMQLASMVGLVRELRTIRFVTQVIRESPRPNMREIRLHRIPAHPALGSLDGRRSFRADIPYFYRLRDYGREAGQAWLEATVPSGASAPASLGTRDR